MAKRTTWDEIKASQPRTEEGRVAFEDEARITAFRELVYRLRTEAGLTQTDLANRMGTTQSALGQASDSGDDNKRRVRRSVASAPDLGSGNAEMRDLLLTDSVERRTDRGVP